jgi:short-subunit dehydrogenase
MELYLAPINVTCVYLGVVNTRLVERGRACDPAKQRMEAQFLAGNGMPAARAARQICRALEANRSRVRIGRETFIFDGLARFFPNVTRRLIANLKAKIAFAEN